MNLQSFIRNVLAVAVVASSTVTSGCAAGAAQASPTTSAAASSHSDAQALAEIRDAIHSYETALNANAIDDILGLYGSEPVFMPQHAPALVGRDAVRAGYEQVFANIKLNIRFEIYDLQQTGEWAWARTSSAGRTRVLAAGTEVDEGNNELFVLRRENGAWKIHRYLFSTNRPRS